MLPPDRLSVRPRFRRRCNAVPSELLSNLPRRRVDGKSKTVQCNQRLGEYGRVTRPENNRIANNLRRLTAQKAACKRIELEKLLCTADIVHKVCVHLERVKYIKRFIQNSLSRFLCDAKCKPIKFKSALHLINCVQLRSYTGNFYVRTCDGTGFRAPP